MLQIAEVLSGENTEVYAQYLMRVLKTIEGEDTSGKVIQEVVEYALIYIRTGVFPWAIQDACSPAIRSFTLGHWWGHRAIDSVDRTKRSYGTHLPPDYNRVGLRVQ